MSELAAGVLSAVADAQTDNTSRPSALVVPASQWLAAATAARDAGATRCEWLTATHLPTGLRVAALVRSDEEDLIIATDLPAASLPSLCDQWPSVVWHERECAEMFGITFADHPDPRPLLLAATDVVAPLRREFPLRERVLRRWPGARTATGESTAGAGGPAQGRRAVGPP
ncbi:MAG: NADH-quinone oxidoreductase subunit C, partial [Actinobacteria bacterium]|nr:NADH-quinone oxidoreductase subunit C [Actinomycetota bacterium]